MGAISCGMRQQGRAMWASVATKLFMSLLKLEIGNEGNIDIDRLIYSTVYTAQGV